MPARGQRCANIRPWLVDPNLVQRRQRRTTMRTPLPQAGARWDDLKPRMLDYAQGDVRWRDGKTAVYVFNAGPEVERVQKEAYALFQSENGLGPVAFPSLKRM